MAIAKMSLDRVVDYISTGLEDKIKAKIKIALMKKAEAVVEEVARDICTNIKANLVSYREFHNDSIDLKLSINGNFCDLEELD